MIDRMLWRGLAAAGLVVCACGAEPEAMLESTAADDPGLGSFLAEVDPQARTVTVTSLGSPNALFGPISEDGGVDSVTVRAENVRFDGACGAALSGVICFDVVVTSLFDTETLSNTWSSLVGLSPASGFEPINADTQNVPPPISGGLAQWSYGDIAPSLSCGGESATVTWIFNFAGGPFSFQGTVYADPVATPPDACAGETCSCSGCNCEQQCDGTNCDFECDGAVCTFGPTFNDAVCIDSNCSITCDSRADACDLQCTGASVCDYDCPDGYCDTSCEDSSTCTMTCGSTLGFFERFFFGLEACEMICEPGAECLLDCNGSPGCSGADLTCLGGDDTQDCGNGVYACNRPCP